MGYLNGFTGLTTPEPKVGAIWLAALGSILDQRPYWYIESNLMTYQH
jgi:hypothetical protein